MYVFNIAYFEAFRLLLYTQYNLAKNYPIKIDEPYTKSLNGTRAILLIQELLD